MDGARSRGHTAARAAIAAMIRGEPPHAVLLVGPSGVGKTTLAVDLAAGRCCTAPDRMTRPCGVCRACRLVFADRHPDVHRLAPAGAGRQIVIGGAGSGSGTRLRGIRDLIADLALTPVEGGPRIAIVTSADRMNEDAQSALLKTLEEPALGVLIILCADAEEPLLATIRSRCARIRLGPVGPREIESILAERGIAEPPLAARLARIAAGRPGLAVAWAMDPAALRARTELSRILLDLTDARPSDRLAAIRAAAPSAASLAGILDRAADPAPAPVIGRKRRGAGARSDGAAATNDGPVADDPEAGAATRTPAVERRRSAEALVGLWSDVARDVALCAIGLLGDVRSVDLLDETAGIASSLDLEQVTAFLDRLGRAGVLLAANVSPELILDDLALTWPRPVAA